ncbi:hypothetical protein J6590_052576 [Homalodisca vitripennis]|nr:hypothetical protein J6590_049784 [Homalodisca vitripennis]KAG8316365.1 hypothetical protein J6590_052576 [Homalodisca vitripennis]
MSRAARRNKTRCLTRRGGGDGSAVSRRGDDEARADCLAVTVQQSRGAVLTRRVPIACTLTVTTRGGGGGTAMTCVVIRAARF